MHVLAARAPDGKFHGREIGLVAFADADAGDDVDAAPRTLEDQGMTMERHGSFLRRIPGAHCDCALALCEDNVGPCAEVPHRNQAGGARVGPACTTSKPRKRRCSVGLASAGRQNLRRAAWSVPASLGPAVLPTTASCPIIRAFPSS